MGDGISGSPSIPPAPLKTKPAFLSFSLFAGDPNRPNAEPLASKAAFCYAQSLWKNLLRWDLAFRRCSGIIYRAHQVAVQVAAVAHYQRRPDYRRGR
ncbi:MAG: hypothetical protein ACREX9_11845 [Gammaproteobacteria bacterium]